MSNEFQFNIKFSEGVLIQKQLKILAELSILNGKGKDVSLLRVLFEYLACADFHFTCFLCMVRSVRFQIRSQDSGTNLILLEVNLKF